MGAHYFDEAPTAPSRPRRVLLDVDDPAVELDADAGMFSADSLDRATRILLEGGPAVPPGDGPLLDLGPVEAAGPLHDCE